VPSAHYLSEVGSKRTASAVMGSEKVSVTPAVWVAAYIALGLIFFTANHDPHVSTVSGFAITPDQLVTAIDTGSWTRRISFIGLGFFGLVLLLLAESRSAVPRNMLAIAVFAVVGFIAASLLWSEYPGITFRRQTVLFLMCLGAFGLSRHIDERGLWTLVFAVTASNLAVGILIELKAGTLMPLAPGYRFAGTLHPNAQGLNISMLILAAIATMPPRRATCRVLWYVISLVAVSFLLLTKSRNALASICVTSIVYWMIVVPWRHRLGVAVLSSGLLAGLFFVLLINSFEPFFMKLVEFGRPDSDTVSLTGRIDLWRAALSYAIEKPVLGYGYEAFWYQDRVIGVSAEVGWGVLHAHSVYVDLLLSIGIIGLVLFVTLLVAGIASAVKAAHQRQSKETAGVAALLIFALFHSTLETSLISASFFGFTVMTAIAILAFPPHRSRINARNAARIGEFTGQKRAVSGLPNR
jgi:O-antigen ligase